MTETPPLFGLLGSILVAVGFYGLAAAPTLIRRIVGFNVAGSGLFVILGAFGARDAAAGPDPVPLGRLPYCACRSFCRSC